MNPTTYGSSQAVPQRKDRSVLIAISVVVVALCVAMIWIRLGWIPAEKARKAEEALFVDTSPLQRVGTYGDSFGAVNSLISSLALFGVTLTLWIQWLERRDEQKKSEENKQSEIARQNLEEERAAKSRAELARTARAQLLTAKLTASSAMLNVCEQDKVLTKSISDPKAFAMASSAREKHRMTIDSLLNESFYLSSIESSDPISIEISAKVLLARCSKRITSEAKRIKLHGDNTEDYSSLFESVRTELTALLPEYEIMTTVTHDGMKDVVDILNTSVKNLRQSRASYEINKMAQEDAERLANAIKDFANRLEFSGNEAIHEARSKV